MRSRSFPFCCIIFLGAIIARPAPTDSDELKLWSSKPARAWAEALPLGNGQLGTMVFGDPANNRIKFNAGTVWAGSPERNENTRALEALSKIRELVFNDHFAGSTAISLGEP